jgi:GNAT superfamily N-acetyltransferase
MEITIRRAKKEDCAALMDLIHELATFERAPEAVTVTLNHFEECGFGEKPIWWAFVAESPNTGSSSEGKNGRKESALVGFALYYIRYSTWKGPAMYLEDILVTEAMRGQGVGKLLFERLIEEAMEKKFSRIIWQVLEWNEKAIRFYKKYPVEFDAEWVNCSYTLAP